MKAVRRLLWDIRSKWKDLGIELDVDIGTLDVSNNVWESGTCSACVASIFSVDSEIISSNNMCMHVAASLTFFESTQLWFSIHCVVNIPVMVETRITGASTASP